MDSIEQREKKLSELGSKSRAGTLMSTLFRAVTSEKTELMQFKVPNSKTGRMQTQLVSKAEAIVRDIVEKALPHKPEDGLFDSKIQMECRKIIMDRVDGRVGMVGEDANDKGGAIPDRISTVSKDFLNSQATSKSSKSKPPVVKKSRKRK
jgi:hypothetical protein